MPIREIPGYSPHATGDGCFFLNSHQLLINDEVTGVQRRERVFTTDEYITEHQWDTIVEFSERFAIEIAGALGWVSEGKVHRLDQRIDELSQAANDALKRMDEAETAGLINMRQASEAAERASVAELRVAELEIEAKDYAGKMSALNRKVAAAERKAKKLASEQNVVG